MALSIITIDDVASLTTPQLMNAATDTNNAAVKAAVDLNTDKATNVSTDLSEGTSTETTVDVNSSDGANATLAAASATRAGVMTKAKFDEVELNNAKVSYTKTIDTATYAANQTLSTAECNGYVIYVTGAATITLPAIASGMSVTIITIGAIAVSVDPNASDKIVLDGTALDDGDKITNLSTAGDVAVLTYYSADGWYASTNSWTDGGA